MDGTRKPSAIVLLSGGIDSAVAAAECREDYRLVKLTIEYGQPVAEKVAAIAIADWLGIPERDRPLCRIPTFNATREPSHYFPMRNLILLGHAAQEAEIQDAAAIIVGCNSDDHADYWDCRREFLDSIEHALKPTGIIIEYPCLGRSKMEVVRRALELNVPLEKTMSCYRPRDRTPCGECNACKLRRRAYEANGLEFKLERLPVGLTMWDRDEA
jgi:7-cyano-7-deazaguanine synthase